MNPIPPRDSRDRWSLFLPVLLAVAAGILVADIVRHLAGAAFAEDTAPTAPLVTVPQEPADGDDDAATADDAVRVTVGPSSGGDVVLLPGPVAAMRDGAERACINDTIALRRPNGWEQGLEHSAPLRCRASSP